MKARLVLDVDEHTRYVVAKYFGAVDEADNRPRATRAQMRRFAIGALGLAVKEQAEILHGRQRATYERLKDGRPEPETLTPPPERQPSLLD